MVRPTSVTDGVRSLGSSLGWVSPIETRSGRTLSAYLSCIHLDPPSLHSRRRNPVLPTTVTLEFSDHLSIPSTIALVGSLYPLRTIDRSPLLGPCCVRSRRFDHLSQTSLSPCFFFFFFWFLPRFDNGLSRTRSLGAIKERFFSFPSRVLVLNWGSGAKTLSCCRGLSLRSRSRCSVGCLESPRSKPMPWPLSIN